MFGTTQHFYAECRAKIRSPDFLCDRNFPSERLLQAIWQHQRLRRDELKTADGKTVRIFHPGFVSLEGGPDFRDAVLQIGDEPPRSGDVEIDLEAAGWRAHGHDRNPNFKSVLLHVVWNPVAVHAAAGPGHSARNKPKPEPQPPVLSLKDSLDAPLTDLGLALENEPLRVLPEHFRGKCCAPLRELDRAAVDELLMAASRHRLEAKAAQFRARAKNAGWEQTLWENLFRALGYKHNVWPMQHLAETRCCPPGAGLSAFEFQARLLGVSGLLPAQLTRTQQSADGYLRRVWDLWWRERETFSGCILPRPAWKFYGLRPANHPHRRLALASHWLADKQFIAKLERWPVTDVPEEKLLKSLHEILGVERDAFWSWHWTLHSERLQKPQPLLGEARATDLAMNVVLPWLWVRAVEGRNENIRREVERRYFSWPAAEDNSVLKLARQRLLAAGVARGLKKAAVQQGLMQIGRDFCAHSDALCQNCSFPEMVRGWRLQA